MTKKEMDEIADTISSVRELNNVPLINKGILVERFIVKLSRYGSFSPDEFRRRCYS